MSSAAQAVRSKFYIVDIETGEVCRTHGLLDSYSESKAPQWNATNIIGRSSPVYGYSYSSSRSVSFTFSFHASVEREDPTTPEDVRKWCLFLLSLAYPDYKGGTIKPPHKVAVLLGGKQVNFTAIMSSCQITYKAPFDVRTGLAYNAQVAVKFDEVTDIPKSYEEIRNS